MGNTLHRWCRKVSNMGGGGGIGEPKGGGGAGGRNLFASCKLIGAPRPESMPNSYIYHIGN